MSLMDILSAFRTGTNPAPSNPTPPQNPASPQNPNLAPGGQVTNAVTPGAPGTQAPPGTPTLNPSGIPVPDPNSAASPLEKFADLWKVDPNAKAPTSITPNMSIDPAKLLELSKGIDFTKALNPEQLANAAKGDPVALAAIINAAGQAGFAHSTNITANLIQTAFAQQEKTLVGEYLPKMLRENAIRDTVRNGNEIFQHPAVAPVVSMLEAAITAKYPAATPAEIKAHTDTWMQGLASAIAQQSGGSIVVPEAVKPGGMPRRAEATDFSSWDR